MVYHRFIPIKSNFYHLCKGILFIKNSNFYAYFTLKIIEIPFLSPIEVFPKPVERGSRTMG